MRESGQTLLIVVLIMVVVLTVGLSVVLRSVTNVRIAVEEDNSARAFSAAESGIEQALKTGVTFSSSKTLDNNAEIKTVTVTSLDGTEFLVNSGNYIEKDDATDIWLVEHNSNGSLNFSSGWQSAEVVPGNATLTVYWDATTTACEAAALEIVVVSGTQSAPVTTRYALDPCDTRYSINKFSPATANTPSYNIGGKYFKYRKEISILSSSRGLLVRINPIYNKTTLAVKGCAHATNPSDASCYLLPSQGKQIESVGASGTTLRKVTFFQGYSKVPAEFFPYVSFTTQ